MNDIEQIILSVVSSGVVAAGITGWLNRRAEARRDRREDEALRRQVRAAARAVGSRIMMARQYGFTNTAALTASIAYLEEISKDRVVEKALSDNASRDLHDAVDLCKTFIGFSINMKIDPESMLSELPPDEREKKQERFAAAAKPTFETLRQFFVEVEATDIVAEFDEAERGRLQLERIRHGLE